MTHSDINKVKVISELLSIRHSYVNLDCFSSEDIDFYDRVHVYRLGLAHSFHVCFYFSFFIFSVYFCTIYIFIIIIIQISWSCSICNVEHHMFSATRATLKLVLNM